MSHPVNGLPCLLAQAVSGCTTPHSLVPASTRPHQNGRAPGSGGVPSGDLGGGLGGIARAAAVSGRRQLVGLGEAGYKYVSAQVGQWRSGQWEGASGRCARSAWYSLVRLAPAGYSTCGDTALVGLQPLQWASFCSPG